MGLPEGEVTTLEPVVVVVYLVGLILLMEVREGVQVEVGLGDVEEAGVRTEAGAGVFLVVEVSRRVLWIALFAPAVRLQVQLLLRKRGESVGARVEATEKSLGKEELRRLDPGLSLIVTVTNFGPH